MKQEIYNNVAGDLKKELKETNKLQEKERADETIFTDNWDNVLTIICC